MLLKYTQIILGSTTFLTSRHRNKKPTMRLLHGITVTYTYLQCQPKTRHYLQTFLY